jgi:hypothetical protein
LKDFGRCRLKRGGELKGGESEVREKGLQRRDITKTKKDFLEVNEKRKILPFWAYMPQYWTDVQMRTKKEV